MKIRPTIVLADDHVLVAEGIRKMLAHKYEIRGIVTDGRALLKAIEEHAPDIAIVDISLPLLNGLDVSRQLRKHHPTVKIIILTMHSDPSCVTEAFRIGVSGYVLKQSVCSELVQALKEVLRGNTFISPIAQRSLTQLTQASVIESDGEAKEFDHTLSWRQREVLQLVAEGKSIKEVASVLNVSNKTVEFHKTRIKKQLGLQSTAQLTKYAIANGLISIH